MKLSKMIFLIWCVFCVTAANGSQPLEMAKPNVEWRKSFTVSEFQKAVVLEKITIMNAIVGDLKSRLPDAKGNEALVPVVPRITFPLLVECEKLWRRARDGDTIWEFAHPDLGKVLDGKTALAHGYSLVRDGRIIMSIDMPNPRPDIVY